MAHGFNDDKSKAAIADFIVENGTAGKWYYEKYNSGTLKAWYNSGQTTVTLQTLSNNGWYRNANPYTISIPAELSCASIRHVDIAAKNDLANMITSVINSTTSVLSYYVSHLGSLDNYPSVIQAEIIGTWS